MPRREDHLPPRGGRAIVRVFIVDDASFIRKALARVLGADPSISVVGEAASGAEALERIPRDHPDLVTLDVDMPGMDGLATLRELRRTMPDLPVIMLSALTSEGAATTLEALSSGAVDFIDKSRLNIMDFAGLLRELTPKIRVWERGGAGIRARGAPRQASRAEERAEARRRAAAAGAVAWSRYDICVVGASTGGPIALEAILRSAPADFPLPIAIVQHMPLGFTKPFAERLNNLSPLRVFEAAGGERLVPGLAAIAPAGRHLSIRPDRTLAIAEEPADTAHRPSVDVMMASACRSLADRVIGVLLTGMGDDGAEGMVQIRGRGGLTIAESDESCVVAGMPRAAYLRGGATLYLPLDRIVSLFASAEPAGP